MGRPRGTTGQAQVLTEQEFKRVIAFVKGYFDEKHQLRNISILFVSFYLGLRISEIALLRVFHVFDECGNVKSYIRLTADMTKSKAHRDVYISHPLLVKTLSQYFELLKSRFGESLDQDMPLFMSQKRGPFSAKTMGKLLKNIYKLAGFPHASSHSGRRSLITNLVLAGYDIKSVSIIAGHKSISTTGIYVQNNPEQLSNILSKVYK